MLLLAPPAEPLPPPAEFQVNSYTSGYQAWARIGAGANGQSVVAWMSDRDGSENGIFGRRFDGSPQGAEFRVNSFTPGNQRLPAVAVGSTAGFIVVWQSPNQDGDSSAIIGQRIDSSGAALGSEFVVNSYTPYAQSRPAVAPAASGGFVVVWDSYYQDGSSGGIFGQRFDSSGNWLDGEFQINSSTIGVQRRPAVTSDPNGAFVVVWEGGEVFGQRFDAGGSPIGVQIQINAFTSGLQRAPAVAVDPAGKFVVVWQSQQDGSYYGIFGQRFGSAGNPIGGEFQINTHTMSTQRYPRVAAGPGGDFVVVWESWGQDGPTTPGVFGQRFEAAGSRIGTEFQVNLYTADAQLFPDVALDTSSSFLITWSSFQQDGSSYGIFGRRVLVTKLVTGTGGGAGSPSLVRRFEGS